MHLYSATLNLNSKNMNQVPMKDLTAAEIAILRAVHGDPTREGVGGVEPVIDIKFTGDVDRSDEVERDRLTGTEGTNEAGEPVRAVPRYGMAQFRKAFPFDQPFPQHLKGFENAVVELPSHPNSMANLKPMPRKQPVVETPAEFA